MKDFLEIIDVKALEILDSRGTPTVQVEVTEEVFSGTSSPFLGIYIFSPSSNR